MTNELSRTPCKECGMPCSATEYHTFAHCLMFKACHDSKTVYANVDFLALHHPTVKADNEHLRTQNSDLFRSLQEVVELGKSQADEFDRFWQAMDCGTAEITVDDAISKYKDLTADNEHLARRITVMEEALNHIAIDDNKNWDNGYGYAESKRDVAIEALAESERLKESE